MEITIYNIHPLASMYMSLQSYYVNFVQCNCFHCPVASVLHFVHSWFIVVFIWIFEGELVGLMHRNKRWMERGWLKWICFLFQWVPESNQPNPKSTGHKRSDVFLPFEFDRTNENPLQSVSALTWFVSRCHLGTLDANLKPNSYGSKTQPYKPT